MPLHLAVMIQWFVASLLGLVTSVAVGDLTLAARAAGPPIRFAAASCPQQLRSSIPDLPRRPLTPIATGAGTGGGARILASILVPPISTRNGS